MNTDTHTRLDIRLHHDYERYFKSGENATEEERCVLHQVLSGIETALEILDGFPIDAPGLPKLDITVPAEDVARWNDRPKLRLVVSPDQNPFDDLTENEREFLVALVDSDFFADTVLDKSDPDNLMTGVCWISCIPGFSDERKHGGVIGSLVKKGLVDTNGEAVRLIRKGAELYAAHVRAEVIV